MKIKLEPNNIETILVGKTSIPIIIEFYGKYKGHPFGPEDMNSENMKRVLCLHDAKHSVALFLTQKDKCDFAIHNFVPFSFPTTIEYTLKYTQRWNYPLLISKYGIPVETLLQKNGVHKAMARWCSRIYKIETPRFVYKHYNLNGLIQVKGMTRFQSAKRSKLTPSIIVDPMSQKKFQIYQELPIFEMTEETQTTIMRIHNLEPNPFDIKYNLHGCMYCPFRNQAYYEKLRDEDPELYAQCNYWRQLGSERPQKDGTIRDYWYFTKSKVM